MNVQVLLQFLNQAKPAASSDATLSNTLLQAYSLKVQDELRAFILEDLAIDALIPRLRDYLIQNHQRVLGTALDYTALPNHPVTCVFIHIADSLATLINDSKSDEFVSPMQLLYPDFNFSTDHEHYPQLSAEKMEPISQEEKYAYVRLMRTGIKKTLDTLRKDIQELESLTERNKLHEIELQQHSKKLYQLKQTEDYQAYHQLAQRFEEQKQKDALIQSGQYTAHRKGMLPSVSTKNVLASHILSTNHTHLIPVQELTAENPCHIYDPHLVHHPLTMDEQTRVVGFSSCTEIYAHVLNQYYAIQNDDSHFLGHLLKLNDAHAGIGRSDSTGLGTYPALIHFRHYYETLTDSMKEQIPEEVTREIQHIFQLASQMTSETTCTGLMRERLEALITQHEATLANIRFSPSDQAQTLATLKQQLQSMKSEPEKLIAHEENEGDKQPITGKLLTTLSVSLNLSSKQSFDAFMKMPHLDIESLAQDPSVQEAMVKQLRFKSDWISFLQEHSLDTIKLFFKLTKAYETLYPCYNDIEDWAELLIELHQEKLEMVFEYFVSKNFMHHCKDWMRLFSVLSPQQTTSVVDPKNETVV